MQLGSHDSGRYQFLGQMYENLYAVFFPLCMHTMHHISSSLLLKMHALDTLHANTLLSYDMHTLATICIH